MIEYHSTDNGYYRVYYKHGNRLVCFQDAGGVPARFELFACTRDGEPSHNISIEGMVLDTLPVDDCSTSHDFIAWVAASGVDHG